MQRLFNILSFSSICALALGACGDSNNPHPPNLGTQIDRMGRAAVNTALIQTFASDTATKETAKEAYNRAEPSAWGGFKGNMMASLAILDSLDEDCGNQLIADGDTSLRYAALADVLVDDQLYVNTASGTCGVYLGLEAEIVGAIAAGAGGCGGRMPDDDIIDRSYSVFAAGILTGVDDTITGNDVSNSATFPFLAAAH
ncbi:MAG: hypothetical protein R3C68_12850 [Myxococcota bacterium]